jgi:outer membrane cobalamin receptor
LRHPIVIWFLLFSNFLAAQKDSVVVLRPDLKVFFTDSVNENNGYNSIKFSSLREQDEREAIGSVYVMDRRTIQASGARDIKELLEYIPSISFGRDVNDVVGLTMRGLWVHEGKFILMINGLPLNELSFGTYCFVKRLNLDNVSHVQAQSITGVRHL